MPCSVSCFLYLLAIFRTNKYQQLAYNPQEGSFSSCSRLLVFPGWHTNWGHYKLLLRGYGLVCSLPVSSLTLRNSKDAHPPARLKKHYELTASPVTWRSVQSLIVEG